MEDQEHGRGVLSDQNGARIVGVWSLGQLTEELVEMFVPAVEVDSIAGTDREQRVFVSTRQPDMPAMGLDQEKREGKALAIFTNGDKYIGGVEGGAKHGDGMYVYSDGTAYKGAFNKDVLGSTLHPMDPTHESDDLRRLHDMNVRHAEAVQALKQGQLGDRKQLPPVPRPLP
jgi:hypothetical protein